MSVCAEYEACCGITRLNQSNYDKQRDELVEKYSRKIAVYFDGELNAVVDYEQFHSGSILPCVEPGRKSVFCIGWEEYRRHGSVEVEKNVFYPKPAPCIQLTKASDK